MTTSSYDGAILVLWDIDHTLVSIQGVSKSIYARAFQTVVGRPMVGLADMAGRTERAIIAETLELNGVGEPHSLFEEFFAALGKATNELAHHMPAAGEALPGAAAAIAAFHGWCAVQSVATGNLRPVAMAKLRAFGLEDGLDLEVGGYGDDGHDRVDLVRRARARAAAKYGETFAGRRTFVIGDTLHDIAGARDAGAYAIGVATGRTSRTDLASAGADVVLSNLTELDALRAAIWAARAQ